MSDIQAVATRLAALCRAGNFVEAVETLYAPHVVSVEAMDFLGQGREMRGKEAVLAKNRTWFSDNEVHRADVQGPFVSPECFAIHYDFDFTRRAPSENAGERVRMAEVAIYFTRRAPSENAGERVRMAEVAIYMVEHGQIVREEFLYAAPASSEA